VSAPPTENIDVAGEDVAKEDEPAA